jgi:hypothetical protein
VVVEADRVEPDRGESDLESIDIARLRRDLRSVGGSIEVYFSKGLRRFRVSIPI